MCSPGDTTGRWSLLAFDRRGIDPQTIGKRQRVVEDSYGICYPLWRFNAFLAVPQISPLRLACTASNPGSQKSDDVNVISALQGNQNTRLSLSRHLPLRLQYRIHL